MQWPKIFGFNTTLHFKGQLRKNYHSQTSPLKH
jgi:hypothetical protein